MERPTFKRYGNDEEGHFFAPVEEPTGSGESSVNWLGMFACFAGLFVLVYVLRNSYSAETYYAGQHIPAPSIWPTVLSWVGGILIGVVGIVFVVYQSLVAYADRSEYWVLRLGRAGIRHGSSVVRLFASLFRLAWSASKPMAVSTAQTIVSLSARSISFLRYLKGDYYLPSRGQKLEGQDHAGITQEMNRALRGPQTAEAFLNSEAGRLLVDMEEESREKAVREMVSEKHRVNISGEVKSVITSNN